MKQKISLLLMTTLYISNATCMLSSEEQKQEMDNVRSKILNRPMGFWKQSTNKDVKDAHKFINRNFRIEDFGEDILLTKLGCLIGSENDGLQNLDTVNQIMTRLLFEANNEGDDALATPKISRIYLNNFSRLLLSLGIADPQYLIKNYPWLILNMMPPLYDTFRAMGLLKGLTTFPLTLNEEEFDQYLGNNEDLKNYLNLIAKVVQSDFGQKDVVLAKLVEKLGENTGFLDFVSSQITEIPVFKETLKYWEKEFKNKSEEEVSQSIGNHLVKETEEQINLILTAISKFRTEFSHREIDALCKRIEKNRLDMINILDSIPNKHGKTEEDLGNA